MRERIIVFCIFLFFSASAIDAQSENLDWLQLGGAWIQYISNPTDSNAAHFRNLLPLSGHVVYTNKGQEKDTLNLIFNDLPKLEMLILAEKQSAVQTAFALMSISDGAMAEALDIMLGKLIRKNATLFLRELNRRKGDIHRLDALVGNFGYEYVDKLKAQCKEKRRRIFALKAVNDPDTREVRDRCIMILNESIKKYCTSSN